MANPLQAGRQIRVEYYSLASSHSMRTYDMYKDYYGIGYMISGDRKNITPDGIYFAHPGDIGIMNIGVYHRSESLSSAPYERYGVKFTRKMVSHLIETIGEECFEEFMSHMGYHLKKETQEKVEKIFADMLDEYEHYTDTSELVLEGMLNHLIITILKERIIHAAMHCKLNVQDDVIMNILSYLDSHYTQNPSIDELCKIACLSRAQFMKRFKLAVGSSYKTYLNTYKVRAAQKLLINTDRSITEISEQLGFCNANYFCNVFKNIIGMSPLDYRRY